MLQYVLAFLTVTTFVALFIKRPNVETYILFVITLMPLMNAKILPLAYGFVKTFDVITLLALLILNKEFLLANNKIIHKLYLILGLLFITITLLSGLNSEFKFANYYNYYPIFTIPIFLRFLFVFYSTEENRLKLISAFKLSYTFFLLFIFLQVIFGLQVSIYGSIGVNVFDEETGVTRYPGFFAESQFSGQYLALGSFVFLQKQTDSIFKKLYFNYIGFACSIVFMLLAGSRSAMGGFLIGVSLIFLLSNIKVKVIGISLGISAIALLYLLVPNNGIFSRTDNLGDDLGFRQSIWKETYEIIKNKPVLGIGLGNFENYTSKYNQSLYLEAEPGVFIYFTQPENGYLKILVEHGVLAFAIFLLFFISLLLKIGIHLFYKSANQNAIYIVAGLLSWLTAFNTVYSLSDYRILLAVSIFLFYLAQVTPEGIKKGMSLNYKISA